VYRGLLWLAIIDLSRAWLRSGLAALAIGLAILAVAIFENQVAAQQAEVLAGYEKLGASTFIVELSGIGDDEVDPLAGASRSAGGVLSVEAPYSGIDLKLAADISFLVFKNEQQQEYLGARTSVIGVDKAFDLSRDYYVNFHHFNPEAPELVLGIPLLSSEPLKPPDRHQVEAASAVTEYVGVRPQTEAIVELIYAGATPAITRRFEGIQLVGTFDAAGPDQGRFEPFWRFASRGEDVLTVRRPDAAEYASTTTLPTVLSADLIREFLRGVQAELAAHGQAPGDLPARSQLVIHANSIAEVPAAEANVSSVLKERKLSEGCDNPAPRSFCIRLPERNNFRAAFQEQAKIGAGGTFFIALLLAIGAVGAAGLQVQSVVRNWRTFGVLQAIGFTPSQILGYHGIQLCVILLAGIAFVAIVSFALPPAIGLSLTSTAWASTVFVLSTVVATLPPLLWPLYRAPAELVGDAP
jgi:hypothetical protein